MHQVLRGVMKVSPKIILLSILLFSSTVLYILGFYILMSVLMFVLFCSMVLFATMGYRYFSKDIVRIRSREEAIKGELYYFIDAYDLWGLGADFLDEKKHELHDGVPITIYQGIGKRANPAYVAWYGLMNLNRHLDTGEKKYLSAFHTQFRWAEANKLENAEGGVWWGYDFDFPNGDSIMKAPWMCGLAQGLMCSLYIRAFKLSGDKSCLDTIDGIINTLTLPIRGGGIVAKTSNGVFLEEYLNYPLTLVLDGSVMAALTIYDLYLFAREKRHLDFFNELCTALYRNIRLWDFMERWSWYGTFAYFSTLQYHRLNTVLMKLLLAINPESETERVVEGWEKSLKESPSSSLLRFGFFLISMTSYLYYSVSALTTKSVLRYRFKEELL